MSREVIAETARTRAASRPYRSATPGVLNPVSILARWDFAWGYGLQSVFVGVYYGILRERTGSVFAGAVAHGIVDVVARLPGLLAKG